MWVTTLEGAAIKICSLFLRVDTMWIEEEKPIVEWKEMEQVTF
jgi:hypothetical protein